MRADDHSLTGHSHRLAARMLLSTACNKQVHITPDRYKHTVLAALLLVTQLQQYTIDLDWVWHYN